MLKEIIRKEMLEHLLGMRFAIACILCLLVVLTSLFVRGLDYTQNLDDYHQNTVMDREAREAMREPWEVIWRNNRINLKPNPMKIFIQGISEQNGGSVTISGNGAPQLVVQDIENTSVPLFPFVDMVFFVGIILSLMAIIFGYNAVSGEKEAGTLRLLLSYSIPRDRVLLGKWLGGYLTLILPFLITVLGMAAIVLMQRSIDLSLTHWIRLMVFVLLSLLYLAAFYSLSLWISSITRKASTSIIVLVSLWVVLVLALPNLSPYLANLLGRSGSLMDINKAQIDINQELWNVKREAQVAAYDKENGFKPGWEKNFDRYDPVWRPKWQMRQIAVIGIDREIHMESLREFEKLDKKNNNDIDERLQRGKWISRLSPFSCLAYSAVELAGEGIEEERRVFQQVNAFKKLYIGYGYDEDEKRHRYFLSISKEKRRGDPWASMRAPFPQFNYQPAAVGAYVRPVLLDAGLLACFTILFFFLAFSAFLRYDVR
jgi:ABC-type transport system involved in multi-copper enzyme maturation permease subunit